MSRCGQYWQSKWANLLMVSRVPFGGKIVWAGIAFLLLATEISGPCSTLLPSGVDLSKEVPAVTHPNDVNRMQQTLLDKGYYRGKVDGVVGLRTRASIRAY